MGMSSFSKKQLMTIRDFGREEAVLHCSCMGTGKTYALCVAFVFYCAMLEARGIKGLKFILLGDTQQTVRRNICGVLANLTDQFKYDMSRQDGQVRDARLFSQNLIICGNSTSKELEKIRGLSDITGALIEEMTHMTEDQYALLLSRIRGEYPKDIQDRWPDGYCLRWWVGSTNPDHPNHFLKKKSEAGEIKLIQWSQKDARYKGSKEYFSKLAKLYAGMPALYDRNVRGLWTSAEGAVYPMFKESEHILKGVEVDLSKIQYTILSVDYGSNHPTAILLTAKTWDNKFIVYKEEKLQRTAPSKIIHRIGELMDWVSDSGGQLASYGVVCDPSAVGLKDEMTLQGIQYQEAFNRHMDGIAFVGSLLTENRLGILEENKNLIDEIYKYKYKPNTVKDEVVKLDDDFVDSLRYAVYTDFKLQEG